jgi:energy-coupling factor transport system permease protein
MAAIAVPGVRTRLDGFNPAAKLLAAAVVAIGLLATGDVLTASVVLAVELVTLPLAGVPIGLLARRAWPLPLAAGSVAVANLIASSASPQTIAAISIRLIAIALPGILVFATTDAVDLADSLVQQLHVPARFGYGALAAFRLLPLLEAEWAMIRQARRARGIDAGRSPFGLLRLFVSTLYALLVAAIRKGTRLALAMDSRGFDSRRPRTAARVQQVHTRDAVLVAVTVLVVGGANGMAAVLGTWHALLL